MHQQVAIDRGAGAGAARHCFGTAAARTQRRPAATSGAATAGAEAAEQPQQQTEQRREAGPGVLRLLPGDSVTEHSIELASGKTLAYTATAGTLALYDQSGEQTAAVFYTAYVAKRCGDAPRPLTFGFNGGPGAASAYLHLGLVGPKILQFGDRNDAATAQLRCNPQTWLEFTDLVMIDPVGSGWSPRRQIRRRRRLPRRTARRGFLRQGDRALHRQERPQRLAEISLGRKLWRLPRRQGRARLAAGPGRRGLRHRDGVADAGRRLHLRRRPFCARRGAHSALARRRRARTHRNP